jgi:[protein-PII] uridylyltransferase
VREAIALCGVGSLGRGDSGPRSDFDLVLVHDGKTLSAPEINVIAERLWYPIWDAGISLDHSVRSLDECRKIASKDLPAAMGLLDVRHIAGSQQIALDAKAALLTDWRSAARKRLEWLVESVDTRTSRFGELAYLIEPDLKTARGGLRDAVSLGALTATWLADRPHGETDAAYGFLLDVRDALQMVSGRATNRLGLAEQDGVAVLLGIDDADQLLTHIAQAGRVITYGLDATLRQVRRAESRTVFKPLIVRGRKTAPRLRSLGQGLVEHDGEVVLSADADVTGDELLSLRAAQVVLRTGMPLSPVTAQSLSQGPMMSQPWPLEAHNALVEILGAGEGLIALWEGLDLAGVITRWIPEWKHVRNLPQRNALHRHTVDRHMIQTVVEAAKLVRYVEERPDILLVASLLHDIGKRPGEQDHAAAGAPVAGQIALNIGFDASDASDIAHLVRHHLALMDIATSRDPADEATLAEVRELVNGRRDLLVLLRALTEADAVAAGPTAWSTMRSNLLDQVYSRTMGTLA